MPWKDDPVVQPSWMDDPMAQPASVNPFNRQMGADVSYGAPLHGQRRDERDLAAEFRAASGGPVMDRAAAAMQTYLPQAIGGTGQDYAANLAQNRADTAAAQAAHPASAAAGTVASALPYMAMPAPAGVLGGMAAGAGAGAVAGGLASPDYTRVEEVARSALTGAGLGAGIGAAGGLAAKGAGAFARVPADPLVPTLETIGPLKTAAYREAKSLGASYTPESFGGLANKIVTDATAADIDAVLHPKATASISRLLREADKGENISLERLDNIRKAIGRDVVSSPDPGERFFGQQIRQSIDNFIVSASPSDMVSGAGKEAASAIQKARDLAQRQFKVEDLTEALGKAENRAGTTGSGDNLENATRQQLRRLYETGHWTPDEASQLRTTMLGTRGQNMLRRAGNMLHPGGLIGAGELAAAALGGPGGASKSLAAALLGFGAKRGAAEMTLRNAGNLIDTVLRGGSAAPIPAPPAYTPYTNALAAALGAMSAQ